MNDDISRRDWVALAVAAGTATMAPGETKVDQQSAEAERCPYFDQPLFCKGRKYCQ